MTPYSVKREVLKANPTTHKTEKTTVTEWKTGAEEREDFVKKFGEKKLEEIAKKDERYARLQFLPFPEGFSWITNHFMKIWRHCETDINGNRIFTPRQIVDYCECFGIKINCHERMLILKMKEWATEAIAELKNEKDKD